MAAPVAPPSDLGGFTPEAFRAHLDAISGAPAWWLDRKRAAAAEFASLPLPKRTDEKWRFASVAGLTLEGASISAGGSPFALPSSLVGSPSLVFVDGRLASAGPKRTDGAVVATLAEALAERGDLLRTHFMAQPQKLGSEKFAALHAAFVSDGAFVLVPRGVEVAEPIVIVHAASAPSAAVFPHTLVVLEENARATVVDYFLSPGGGAACGPRLAVGANDLYAGHGSRLTYAGIQNWSPETLSFQLNSTVVRRDARVQSLNLHLGARQARHESMSQLQAPGALSEMLALTLARGSQEFDQRTLQIHQAPDTKSDLLYKNVLFDRARTIFSGLIIVDPDAQRTDAYQSNRNLMLSEEAEANSLPGLEIQANDVRCTHGATTGRIDPEMEFYLKSRGVTGAQAEELLVFGFFEETLNRVDQPALHRNLTEIIARAFGRGPQTGG